VGAKIVAQCCIMPSRQAIFAQPLVCNAKCVCTMAHLLESRLARHSARAEPFLRLQLLKLVLYGTNIL
jgi:hypothetical protein